MVNGAGPPRNRRIGGLIVMAYWLMRTKTAQVLGLIIVIKKATFIFHTGLADFTKSTLVNFSIIFSLFIVLSVSLL